MRIRRVLIPVVVAFGLVATAVVAAPASGADEPHYYLALGDSLSRGYMPGVGDTDQGYVDDTYAVLHASDPSLQLVKLGCSGETTTTMINGGKCLDRYSVGSSQLDAAAAFLHDHPGAVTYMTLDIGANDVDGCASGGSIDAVCVTQGLATIAQNLNTILCRLSAAAGGHLPRSAGMTYYDPFLASWLTGVQGQLVAIASVPLLETLNTTESALYVLYGWRVADVGAAFHSTDFLTRRWTPGYGLLPANVSYICQYTYMCSLQNIHANVAGYQLIADVFVRKLS